MTNDNGPRVSIAIPVYNGERFIADCIRSVQAQTYQNWDLVIGNNHSKDRTVAIAEEFARQDPRIRVVTYPSFVSVVESHNNAFGLISSEAKWCMVLGADDLLFPNNLEEKVRVAESHPTIGLVGSYVLEGDAVMIPCYRFPDTFIPGREVARFRFLKNTSLFGGPSTSLLRADWVRAHQPFYNPVNYYGDLEAYLELLTQYDFGFVHQVLTYTRKGTDSRTTSYLGRVDAPAAMRMHEIKRFGAAFLTPEENAACVRRYVHAYYRYLGDNVWEMRKKEFWDYHLQHVRKMGHPPRWGLISWYAVLRLLDFIGNPLRTVNGLLRRVTASRRRRGAKIAESHGPAPTVRSADSGSASTAPSVRTATAP